jgi:hypothetical protein
MHVMATTPRSARTKRLRAAAGLAGVLSALTWAAVALGAASLSDPVGDNNAAPDITALTVAESPGDMLTVTLTISGSQTLPLGSWVNVWFDLDNNARTGEDGDEALVQYFDDGGMQFHRWVGSELVRRPTVGITGTAAAGVLTLSLPKAALDNAASFGVLGVGSREQDNGDEDKPVASDFAPNTGRARYVQPGPLSVTDPAGDHDAAPDISQVEISDTKAGTIGFIVSTPSHPTISPGNTWIELDVDIDRRRSTGDDGVEAYVIYEDGGVYAARWSAARQDFVQVRGSGVRVQSSGGRTTFVVPRRFLDDVASFDFYFVSGDWDPSEEVDNALDLAPDGDAWWRYRLGNTAPLRLMAGAPTGKPTTPVAGKLFTVSVPVTRSDTARGIATGSVTCVIRIAGRSVKVGARVRAGNAICSIVVPRDAGGRLLRGSMLVRSSGKSITTRFAYRVR